MSATHSRAVSRYRCAGNILRVRGVQPMDRSTCWVLDRAVEAPLSPRRQPTKKEACTFAAISRGCMQSTPRTEMSLARRERIRANSGPYLNSASSSAAISQNSGVEALAPRVRSLLRAQTPSTTNQSPQKWKQFKRKAFGVIDGVRYTTGQAQAISNCVGLGLRVD